MENGYFKFENLEFYKKAFGFVDQDILNETNIIQLSKIINNLQKYLEK